MPWPRLCIIPVAFVAFGGLYQLVDAQLAVPSKIPPVAGPVPSPSDAGRDWINRPPASAFSDDAAREIEGGDVYEVVASKNIVPIVRDLKDHAYVKLTPDSAAYFTGPYFKCPAGKTPYLVRAVYGFGGTGKYFVKRSGRKLLVEHGSLGHIAASNKSALVVNLDFEPEVVHTAVHIAE